ncbi:hypothetical protein TNCV_2531941 [Trichonephila clavipes]|nr:hypothetical protein TNCV_2531941 [Trichonephila clavipes]
MEEKIEIVNALVQSYASDDSFPTTSMNPWKGYSCSFEVPISMVYHIHSRNAGHKLADLEDCAVQRSNGKVEGRERILQSNNLGSCCLIPTDMLKLRVLDEIHGINILGNIVESSYDSVNVPFSMEVCTIGDMS